MIVKVKGDILLTEAKAIVHGVAPHDHFIQGLALALRDRFPMMAKDFRHYCHQDNPKAGGAWLWAGPEGVVINLMTQDAAVDDKAHPGKATSRNVAHALKALRGIIEKEGLTSVALPALATGVGGMDWAEVDGLIREALGDVKGCTIIVYEGYAKGQKAQENLSKAA